MQKNTTIVKLPDIEKSIITIGGQQVLIDSDVARIYGVMTKHIIQAVKNNPDKFPYGYIIPIDESTKAEVVKNFDHLSNLRFSHASLSAFTEKGLYMLATILKSPQATAATISIIEAFTKLRELSRAVAAIPDAKGPALQKSLMQKSSELMADLIDSGVKTVETETSIEINFAIVKVKRTVKKGKK